MRGISLRVRRVSIGLCFKNSQLLLLHVEESTSWTKCVVHCHNNYDDYCIYTVRFQIDISVDHVMVTFSVSVRMVSFFS